MIALSVSDVNLSFGTDIILKDISFAINDGDRLGVIGVNGAGKTSLFKVITGEYTPDSGAVYVQKGHTVGVLEQNADLSSLPGDMSCIEYMYTAYPTLLALEKEIARTESMLLGADSSEAMTLTARLNEQNTRFASLGGLEFRSRCRGMLLRLGFDDELIDRQIRTLSGGQYTRLALARLLATEPDILMLDEPTNHLDIDALAWLESFLSTYKKTVIIISHDRYFLDRTTNKTLWLRYGKARLYTGSYSKCKEQSDAEAASLEHRYKEQQKEYLICSQGDFFVLFFLFFSKNYILVQVLGPLSWGLLLPLSKLPSWKFFHNLPFRRLGASFPSFLPTLDAVF